MTSVFVLFFVVILGPTHPNFQVVIDSFGFPVYATTEKYTTREECMAILNDLIAESTKPSNQGHIHTVEGSCKEYSYPTRPETGV